VPAETAVTAPDADTVATAVALLLHVTALFAAFAGATVAVIVRDGVSVDIVMAVGETVTPVTRTGVTFTTHLSLLLLPSTVVAVISTRPTLMPLTTPNSDTVAMSELLVLHETFLFKTVSSGKTLAVRVRVL